MPDPLLTVLLCVWNGEAYLRAAIESVLRQSYRDFEFLIIDDASTDTTAEILRATGDPRVRVLRNERNLGLTASLNRGLAEARGEFIARQDADDLSHPDRFALQLSFLHAHHSSGAVGAQARLIDGRGRSLGKKDFPLGFRSIWWAHLFDNALAHSAVIFRRNAVQNIGGYDESYRASQDYELWSRLGERHLLANLPERLVTLRILDSSITRTHKSPELIRGIQAAHAARLFPGRQLTAAELDLLGLFRTQVPPAALAEFLALFQDLLLAFGAAWPDAMITGDFARTLALQYERIGYNLLPKSRLAGMRLIARALRVWPPRALAMPWARMAALATLGDSARGLYERLAPTRSSKAEK